MPATSPSHNRRGVVLVFSAVLLVVICAMAAMGIDVGYMMVVKTQLQVAADAGALAAGNSLHLSREEVVAVAKQYATEHNAGGRAIQQGETVVEIGVWDADASRFSATAGIGNAVRVTATRGGEALFFARVLGADAFSAEASAIAMANPKDIALVIDLSGSMNDDTEPAWATTTINSTFGSGAATGLMHDVYADLGFGPFPGALEYLGAPVGLAEESIAYAELTKDDGPLAAASVGDAYRIAAGDDEAIRRRKSYAWIIDHQLARLMPNAQPYPSSASSYGFWEKYIDYVIEPCHVQAPAPPPPPPSDDEDDDDDHDDDGGDSGGGGGSKPSPPPGPSPPIGWLPALPAPDQLAQSHAAGLVMLGAHRLGLGPLLPMLVSSQVYGAEADGPGLPRAGGLHGGYSAWLPPSQDGDRINRFNNPNPQSFPGADRGLPNQLRNYFGYLTYVQFLMDHGRDLMPDGATHVQLSLESGNCPMHDEAVAGRTFQFPPRCQPMHAVRRSTISGLDILDERNTEIPTSHHRDQVALVTFDTVDGSNVLHGLTSDYQAVMDSVTTVQAVGDKGTTTATQTGLALAQQLLRPVSQGGTAREQSTKVAVLLTDGMPNCNTASAADIDSYFAAESVSQQYGGGYYWLDAAVMQTHSMQAARMDVFPIGIGMGTDYDFMDRIAQVGGTAGADGRSPHGSGDPSQYEAILTDLFEKILATPTAKLVE